MWWFNEGVATPSTVIRMETVLTIPLHENLLSYCLLGLAPLHVPFSSHAVLMQNSDWCHSTAWVDLKLEFLLILTYVHCSTLICGEYKPATTVDYYDALGARGWRVDSNWEHLCYSCYTWNLQGSQDSKDGNKARRHKHVIRMGMEYAVKSGLLLGALLGEMKCIRMLVSKRA